MGRIRKIMKDDILDAAERVVMKLGAAGLSIDAVAQEAGVSKSTVVYDHKSKSVLLEALIDRRMKIEIDRQAEEVEKAKDTPHPELFGRIKAAEQGMTDLDRAVSMAIGASVSQDEKVQKLMRDWTLVDLEAMSGGPKPEAALMAYLALTGIYVTELFAYHQWTEDERAKILEGVRTIYATYPNT
ncbi:TetR family transcriptional regulator [Rhizobiales bacterium RZME27]|uniref:TetR family transcriptional regulator n=1 Tax=Endobacterium cereale TaxID=2663029 RepID=A0A6A8AC42_9HYPH|nr:TetR/AcrR family transcriptional regulator [Endobacterium cereale]MEB2847887.1 TetR/AcrR family transcriptional regulator [Endobacterium cereale]MQY46776.1 TetR family transcriptional regulator [Endobacterium cereale]